MMYPMIGRRLDQKMALIAMKIPNTARAIKIEKRSPPKSPIAPSAARGLLGGLLGGVLGACGPDTGRLYHRPCWDRRPKLAQPAVGELWRVGHDPVRAPARGLGRLI